MKFKLIFFNIGLLFIFSSLLYSCNRFYDHNPKLIKKQKELQASKNKQWSLIEEYNHVVIHLGTEMKEIYSIRYNEKTDSIKCFSRPFEGKPLEYYNKVLASKSGVAKRSKESTSRDIKQVHVFMNSYDKISGNEISFSIKDIYQVDVTDKAVFLNALATTGIIVGAAAATVGTVAGVLIIVCNCPHVYIDNGDGLEFNNTLFTGAKAPQLERFDYKDIPDYYPESNQFSLKIINEEKEDQFTNLLELVTVLHDKEIEVISDKYGKIHTIRKLITPNTVVDNDNYSLLNFLNDRDDYAYRFDPSTLDDLATVSMSFDAKDQTNDAKLVIRARNTMWSGYVYNEFNKLFGKNHGKWVEMNKDKSKEEREKWMREQGIKMLVDLKQNGEWVTIDEVEVFGEASLNEVIIPIKRELFQEELEVRLRSGYMFWELDYVGVDFSKNEVVEMQVHKPAKATGNNGQDFTPQLSLDDDNYMKHELESEVNSTDVLYDNLPVDPFLKRTLILKSKGYYVPKSDYTGKTDRKRLQPFVTPGELSRFSRELYDDLTQEMVVK